MTASRLSTSFMDANMSGCTHASFEQSTCQAQVVWSDLARGIGFEDVSQGFGA